MLAHSVGESGGVGALGGAAGEQLCSRDTPWRHCSPCQWQSLASPFALILKEDTHSLPLMASVQSAMAVRCTTSKQLSHTSLSPAASHMDAVAFQIQGHTPCPSATVVKERSQPSSLVSSKHHVGGSMRRRSVRPTRSAQDSIARSRRLGTRSARRRRSGRPHTTLISFCG